MKTLYRLNSPDEVEASITLTGTVGEFKSLKEILDKNPASTHWPHGTLRNAVVSVITDAGAHFESEVEKDASL